MSERNPEQMHDTIQSAGIDSQIPPQLVEPLRQIAKAYAPEDIKREMNIDEAETPSELLVVLLRAGISKISDDVRQNVEDKPDPEVVRKKIESMPVEKQEEFRDECWNEFIASLVMAFQQGDPEAFRDLKGFVRDPYFVEGLYLEFKLSDPEESREFMRDVVTWLGMSMFPRMYSEEERETRGKELDEKFMGE